MDSCEIQSSDVLDEVFETQSQSKCVCVCSCGFVCWRAFVCLIADSQVVLWGIENSLQTTQCPWCKHTICHHRLQCEIGLPADFTPAIFPDSLEQIVIRDN